MLRDDIEIISGRLIRDHVTTTLFTMLRDTKNPDKLFEDLGIERRRFIDSYSGATAVQGQVATGGLSFEEWLSRAGQPVTVQRNAKDDVRPNENKKRRHRST